MRGTTKAQRLSSTVFDVCFVRPSNQEKKEKKRKKSEN